ncbi:MAG: hypothetical protein K1X57_18450 [Gemmataceae bacterium]|nr:hypothetical protein [Gemmataceae bacterium]
MKLPGAIRQGSDWLFGSGSAVLYQGKCRTDSWTELCHQMEEVVRVSCPESDGYAVHPLRHKSASFVRVYHGLTDGLSVSLIPQERPVGGSLVRVSVNRWSRLHSFGVQLVTAFFFLALIAGIAKVAVAGWQVPFLGWILLAISAVASILFTKVLFLGINRVAWRDPAPEMEERANTLVKVVRAVVEASPAEPSGAADSAGR